MTKIRFPTELDEHNRRFRDFLINTLEKYIDLSESEILEIGVANGRIPNLIGNKVKHFYGIDISEEYIEMAKKETPDRIKTTYKVGRAEKMPFDRTFDAILLVNTWHMIKGKKKALNEMKRVLEKEGIILIIDPTDRGENKWVSPRLNKDSDKFDKNLYEKKIKNIREGEKEIQEQKTFKMKENRFIRKKRSKLYILKNK